MKSRKNAQPRGPQNWTVGELGAFYVHHRSELLSHASRVLKDKARAEEVTQEALIKVMISAPELESKEHALSYLHRTIENLCIDTLRMEGRRPTLVLLDDATVEIEARWQQSNDQADVLVRAEDAAVVRQALALLSPAERAALVMWEIEGRSTEEIAAELKVSVPTVRHTVSRARASLRRILSELVLDESRGLTALDFLSSSYRKANEIAKKSSKVSLSLILVLFAFFGFNTMQPNVEISSLTDNETTQDANFNQPNRAELPAALAEDKASLTAEKVGASKSTKSTKKLKLSFPGLDKSGVPISFTAADSSGGVGEVYFREHTAISADLSLATGQILKTGFGAANIFIAQTLDSDENGIRYNPVVSFGQDGVWVPLVVSVNSTEIRRLSNGDYLLTAFIAVESELETPIKITATANGRDLAEAPRQVITRLVLDRNKTQVLAQAIYVVEQGASA